MGRRNPLRATGTLGILALIAVALLSTGCSAPFAAGKAAPAAMAPSASGVEGAVLAPTEGVYVYVYRKGADPHGPADVILPAPTGADGRFAVELPPGEYTLVARRRGNLENSGPLSEGDLRSGAVTVAVRAGEKVSADLVMNSKQDSAVLSFAPPKEWTTGLSGTVRDADGNPVEGARVHVYTYVQMSERPKYVSERTGPDGKYVVFLPKGGTYYLAARNRFGGPPRIGDLYGRFDEGSIDPTGVVVRDGERRETLDITMFKVW
ncbi:MAG TPA: carboxypeptidase-like regulatory domain-containing protein [Candidatus Deferrimicrobiaceae bacterium]